METLKTVLQIPVLLLILYFGSVTLYESARALQATPRMDLGWQFYASIVEGMLEVVLLAVLYRWFHRPRTTGPNENSRTV